MAYHFSANQYEDRYDPKKLGNWEYPKWFPDRPRQRFKPTKFIADDNGRLLEGIEKENPWGNYVGTWELPRRITREYVKQITAPPEKIVSRWGKKKKAPAEDTQRALNEQEAEELNQQESKEENQEEAVCERCGNKNCICDKMSGSNSSIEKCDDSHSCPKCRNEICLCENECRCVHPE